ncbi:hypothetical protein C5E16_15430 [Clavibacter michiganensis]|uniref:Uncharacterized protein n=1 Tax=Clavibacter michiganensis TaxID=28447 RepID=A0A2S5VL28_9MICO|nr:hypothetical protein C5E16_15430 [Clavibacter michiganensis]
MPAYGDHDILRVQGLRRDDGIYLGHERGLHDSTLRTYDVVDIRSDPVSGDQSATSDLFVQHAANQ